MSDSARDVTILPVHGIGEVRPGDDLVDLLLGAGIGGGGLHDGDLLVVTSKVVSKAEGRAVRQDKDTVVAEETTALVAARGATRIVRTRHGLVLAAAGVDTSNVAQGVVLPLPEDPDASARGLREQLAERTGRNVGVVVSDTAGRPWRTGQVDLAVGAAGLRVLEDHAGRTDPHGNELAVTMPAWADEVAAAADLATGKLSGCPIAVVRGLADLVLPPGRHGPGAVALVRPPAQDMFALGSREAVVRAVRGLTGGGPSGGADEAFGAPAPAEELLAAVTDLLDARVEVVSATPERVQLRLRASDARERDRLGAALDVLGVAYGWRADGTAGDLAVLRRRTP